MFPLRTASELPADSAAEIPCEQRVLILAPDGRNADIVATVLSGAGLSAEICRDAEQLRDELSRGAAAVVLAGAAVRQATFAQLLPVLSGRPPWWELPLVLVASGPDRRHWVREWLGDADASVQLSWLPTPLRTNLLLTAIRAAVSSRRKQYQVRDELAARTEAEKRLAESEQLFRSTFSECPVGIAHIGLDGRWLRFNDAVCALVGYSREELRQMKFADVTHPDDIEPDWEAARRLRRGEISRYSLEKRYLRRDGHPVWVNLSVSLHRDKRGKARHYIAVIEDISERRAAEAMMRSINDELERQVAERTAVAERRAADLQRLTIQLNEAEHRERQHLATVLHDDLQQLLVGIRLTVPGIASESEENRPQQLGRIDRLLEQCLAICRNLTRELSPPVLEHGDFVQAVEWLAKWFGETHRLTISLDLSRELPDVPEHLKLFLFQALRELLLNVVKHSGGTAAQLRADYDGRQLVVEVEDEGAEFAPDAVDMGIQRSGGFGLFNIRERLDALGGKMRVTRGRSGGGLFRLFLPLASGQITEDRKIGTERKAATEAPDMNERSDSAVRLLVVDDHAVVREGLISVLNGRPELNIVGEATSGQDAIDQAAALSPDVILMDINMPGMDGIEATRNITASPGAPAVIGLSLHDDESVRNRMLDAGAARYICKDSDAERVVETVLWAAGRHVV